MKCHVCGDKSTNNYCKNCNMDIGITKKIYIASRRLYNTGLEKIKEKDLSTAITLLTRSLDFDKKFIDGRNLLGLVYYRTGDIGQALKQWKISYIYSPDDDNNQAYHYMKTIYDSNNRRKYDQLKSTLKMYNESLNHVKENNEDLAIIKLKKAIHINPSFIKANNLLALCYLKGNHKLKATHYINNVLAVDHRNPIAVYYKSCIIPQEGKYGNEQENKSNAEKNRNIIIEKIRNSMAVGHLNQLVIFFIGISIGIASMIFLLVPDKVSSLNHKIQEMETNQRILIEQKENLIEEQQEELNTLNGRIEEIEAGLLDENQREVFDKLFLATQYYMEGDLRESGNTLLEIDINQLTDEGLALYNELIEKTF